MTDDKLSDRQIAWIIHEAHRALQMTDPLRPHHVMPAPPWVTMTPWQKETVTSLVRLVRDELEGWAEIGMQYGTDLDLPPSDETLAAKAHAQWVERFTGKGWTRGEEKDPVKKTHPNLVDWGELSPYEQAKTLQAVAIAKVHI